MNTAPEPQAGPAAAETPLTWADIYGGPGGGKLLFKRMVRVCLVIFLAHIPLHPFFFLSSVVGLLIDRRVDSARPYTPDLDVALLLALLAVSIVSYIAIFMLFVAAPVAALATAVIRIFWSWARRAHWFIVITVGALFGAPFALIFAIPLILWWGALYSPVPLIMTFLVLGGLPGMLSAVFVRRILQKPAPAAAAARPRRRIFR